MLAHIAICTCSSLLPGHDEQNSAVPDTPYPSKSGDRFSTTSSWINRPTENIYLISKPFYEVRTHKVLLRHYKLITKTYNSTFDSSEMQRSESLWCFTNSRTDPLVMNGMISSGRLVTHTPSRDMTLMCSSDNMVDTSFDSCSVSILEKSAEKEKTCFFAVQNCYLTLNSFDCNQFFSSRSCQIRPVDQSRLTYVIVSSAEILCILHNWT